MAGSHFRDCILRSAHFKGSYIITLFYVLQALQWKLKLNFVTFVQQRLRAALIQVVSSICRRSGERLAVRHWSNILHTATFYRMLSLAELHLWRPLTLSHRAPLGRTTMCGQRSSFVSYSEIHKTKKIEMMFFKWLLYYFRYDRLEAFPLPANSCLHQSP